MTADDAPLTSDEWAEIEARFLELADRSREEQSLALADERQRHPRRARELERLLRGDAVRDSLLDGSIASRAADLLGFASAVPDTPFGPYRLVRAIGEGGMGVVYLAQRDDLGSQAAIKVLRDAWLSPSRRARFLEEQRTLVRLQHPGIARLLDADQLEDGTPWFAMEFVDGVPITEWCWSRDTPLRDRLRLVIDALQAVRHAHERAVIHRDLKPSNLFVTAAGQVRLLDFGIAKRVVETPLADGDVTRTGLRLLTPAYAAPEQLAGEPVTVQADVYAVGVMLFELLAGERPFDVSALSTAEAVRRLRSEPAPRLSQVVRRRAASKRAVRATSLTAAEWHDLDALLAGALEADCARRYRSADALLRDLERFLASQPLEMRPASLAYRARLLLRRRRLETLLAAAATVVVLVGATTYTRGITAARDAARAQAERTERLQQFLVGLFAGGDAEAGPADTLRVASLLDNGVREARALADAPEAQRDMLRALGTIAQQLGRYELADTLFQEAAAGWIREHGDEHEEALRTRVLAAGVRLARQDHDAARDSFRVLLAAADRTLAPDHPVRRDAAAGLGAALTELGDYDTALALLEDVAQRHAAEDSTSVAYADAITAVANVHFYAARYDTSDALNTRALDILQRRLGDSHPSLAENHINLASAAFERARYDDAEPHYLRALALTEGWYGAEHPRTAPMLRMLAQLRIRQERADDAVPLLERAARTFERSVDSLSPSLANLYSTMAQVHAQQGRHDEAARLHRRARDIAERTQGTSHLHFRMHTGNLASTLGTLGRLDEASALLTPVVIDARATLPADDVNLAYWTLRLARIRVAQRRVADADTLYAQGIAGLRASGFADSATIARFTQEREALQPVR